MPQTLQLILQQGGSLAVAGVLWVILRWLVNRYATKEDRAAAEAARVAKKKDKLHDDRVSDVDEIHRHYAEVLKEAHGATVARMAGEIDMLRRELAKANAARVADQRLVTSGAAALADVVELLDRAFATLELDRNPEAKKVKEALSQELRSNQIVGRAADRRPREDDEEAPR